jgi:hypothetical protein
MGDVTDLTGRRHNRQQAGTRRNMLGDTDRNHPPRWTTTFTIPRDACEACARHWHHKCWGVNVLLDPIPNCPCDCGDPRDPARLNARAWADLAVHCPEEVWKAALLERHREGVGTFVCAWREDESGMRAAR